MPPLRKRAYSNILKIVSPKNKKKSDKKGIHYFPYFCKSDYILINSADPDQLASEHANCSGSDKKGIHYFPYFCSKHR